MNAKKCKALRKQAMLLSTPNEPLRQLVQYAQIAYDAKGKRREAIAAVNNPESFRGRYRSMKSGRSIDPKRLVVHSLPTYSETTSKTPSKTPSAASPTQQQTFWQKLKAKLAKMLHR